MILICNNLGKAVMMEISHKKIQLKTLSSVKKMKLKIELPEGMPTMTKVMTKMNPMKSKVTLKRKHIPLKMKRL